MGFFIENPGAALLIGFGAFAAFIDQQRQKNRKARVLLLAAVLWVSYAAWEWFVRRASIRMDLVLIYPLLATVSVVALKVFIEASEKAQETKPGDK